MMAIYALINKEVIPFVCAGKKVSVEFLHERTNFQIDKLNQWLDVTDASLPTILQAKKLAKCLHTIRNYRTLDGCPIVDDSGFNIAICDVLQERDFLLEESSELGIPVTPFSVPSCTTDNPIDWAYAIRQYYAIDIKDQYRCTSSRKFYLYLREKLEQKGVFVQCFTDVPVEIVRGFSIYEHKLPIIVINDDDRPIVLLDS